MTSYDNHDVYSVEIWAKIGSLLDNHMTDRQEICQEPVEAAGYFKEPKARPTEARTIQEI
jgi:hypothetical protein